MTEALVHDALLSLLPSNATADWDDVVGRAGINEREYGFSARSPRRARAAAAAPQGRLSRRRAALAVVAGALAIGGGGTALAFHYFGPSPGFTAGFSAVDRLSPAPLPPAMPAIGFDRMAAYVGLTPARARERLRLLQRGLSLGPRGAKGEGALYALVGDNGTACMFLLGHGGTCLNREHLDDTNGVLVQANPGYPGDTPAVAALVADNVRAVDFVANGERVHVPIVNNSVYHSLESVRECDTLALDVSYENGSRQAFPLHNPTGDVVETTGSTTAKSLGAPC